MTGDVIERLGAALAERYRLERELGAGGMATVYLAEDLRHHRKVAIKVLRPELTESVSAERFLREITIAARLTHPHILALHDSGEAAGALYYVMPYLEGESLRARLEREGALPIPDTVRLAREVADALAYAHTHGVVHRDIKPENILLVGSAGDTHDGAADVHALVADFGVARAVTDAVMGDGALTTAGMAVGTPAYMAPEQAAADPRIDSRADLYALGVVLYEMLTGRPPFVSATPQQLLAAQVTEAPDPVQSRRASIPAPLAALVMQCLEKQPADRPSSAAAVRARLDAVGTSSGDTAASPSARPRRRMRPVVLVAAAVVVLVVAAAWRVRTGGSGASDGSSAPRMVAVLPFRTFGPDSTGAYLGDGMSEEILTALSRLPGLSVIGRSSSFRFRGPDVDVRQVGRELGATVVLDGTVQRAGDAVRVTAELVDARSGRQLWSQTFDRRMGDLFALEDDIARSITEALRVQLGGATLVRRGTSNPTAHDLVLRANALYIVADEQSTEQAAALYRQAIALDSGYAAAWAGLSEAYAQLADAYRSPAEMAPLAEQAAQRAVALDDSSALAHDALGVVRFDWQWRYADARRELRRALALDPGLSDAHLQYANLLLYVDQDFEGAARELDTAAMVDPANPSVVRWQQTVAIARRDTAAAFRLARRVTELSGGPVYYNSPVLALAYALAGRWSDCARTFDAIPATQVASREVLAMCLGRLGDTASAGRVLQQIVARPYADRVHVAEVQLAMGEREAALASLARAAEDRSANVIGIRTLPWLAALWGDPRFDAILAQAGLPPHGPPHARIGVPQ